MEDQKKRLAKHWDRFQNMDPEIINAPATLKGPGTAPVARYSGAGECALRNTSLVFEDAIARAETTIDSGVTAGMRTQVSNARQKMYVGACQYFHEEAESIYKALS